MKNILKKKNFLHTKLKKKNVFFKNILSNTFIVLFILSEFLGFRLVRLVDDTLHFCYGGH